MREFNIGDIVYFDFDAKRGRGKILEKDERDCNVEILVEMLDAHNKGTGHNGFTKKYKGNNCWYIPMDAPYLKLIHSANTESIHITCDGNKVHAILKHDGKVVKRAEARCHPDDVFDFETGAEIAFNRLFNEGKEDKKKDDEIKVGDIVRVVNKGRIYPTYYEWFDKYAPEFASRYAYCNTMTREMYKVLAMHKHDFRNDMLYAIQEWDSFNGESSPIYLISADGIEKIGDEKINVANYYVPF